jgi:hypothetical protein
MGEVAAVAAALDAAIAKTAAALPDPPPPPSAHDATLACRRAGERLRDAVAYYAPPRLPAAPWARRAVAAGAALQARGHLALAASACFAPVLALGLCNGTSPPKSAPTAQPAAVSDLELHVQAALGLAACQGGAALARDPHLRHVNTLAAALAALRDAKAAAMTALPHEALYHLAHDAAAAIAGLAEPLAAAGFCGQALQYAVFAAKVRREGGGRRRSTHPRAGDHQLGVQTKAHGVAATDC